MRDDPSTNDASMKKDAWRESRAPLILMAVAVAAVLIFGAATLVGQFGGAGGRP